MAKTKVVIDPITRIEGHLRVTCVVENGKVKDAWNTCTLFRGFEIFMKDRDPRDDLALHACASAGSAPRPTAGTAYAPPRWPWASARWTTTRASSAT